MLFQPEHRAEQGGHYDQAEALARSLVDPDLRSHALAQAAGCLAKAGPHIQVKAPAQSCTDPNTEALAEAAENLALAGKHDQAKTLAAEAEDAARSITGPYARAEALAQVAESLARAGQHDRAEAVARSITDPDQRAQALTQLAMGLTAAGRTTNAACVTAAALAAGKWQIAAGPAPALNPSGWTRIEMDLRRTPSGGHSVPAA